MELLDQKAKDSTKPRDSTESGSTDGRSSQLSANTARSFIRHSMIGSGSLSVAGSTVSGNTKSIGTSELRFRKKVLTHFMKTEMLLEIMEGSQKAYNSFKKSSNGILETYRAETEEAKIYIGEGQISLDTFEQTVVVEGLDRISQRIPAEKWLKYMNNWTRQGQFIVQKLLLHKNNEAITLRKLKSVLKERQLLAENIHAVDFDQLTIENKNLKTKIDQRSKFVKELKKLNGWANVILSNSRYFLQSQFNDISQFKFLKEQSENRRENIDKESVKVQGEIEDAKKKYEECKSIKENYIMPDTMEYVAAKSNLRNTYKKLKVVERQQQILDIALNACTGQMKSILKTKKIDTKWFESYKISDNPSFSEFSDGEFKM